MQHRTSRAPRTLTAAAENIEAVADVLEDGGLVAASWGHPRRATYALLTRADDAAATTRLNRLKGRPSTQVLAVVGATQVATRVADTDPGGALDLLARKRDRTAAGLLEAMYATGPVAVMLDARDHVPPAVTSADEAGRRRVLVVGQAVEPGNFYDLLVDHLATERDVLLAGTSGNRSGLRTYTSHDHWEAQADLAADVDVFVAPQLPIPARRPWDAPVSCSGFDLTGADAALIRHGSLHPLVFAPVLGRVVVAPTVQRIAGRQSLAAGLIERVTGRRANRSTDAPAASAADPA